MTISANLSNLVVLLSGGAANTSELKSVGGPISAQRVLSQAAAGITTITGVTIDDANGNGLGAGTLSFNASALTLQWAPPGGTSGTAVDVSQSGSYAIQGGNNGGLLNVTVSASSLPGSNQSNTLTITNQTNKVWDDVTKTQSLNGKTSYRCIYVKNSHSTDSIVNLVVWRSAAPTGQDTLSLELDPAGIGDGTASGVAAGCFSATGAAITAASWTGGVATFHTTQAVSVGDLVNVSGVTPSGWNGEHIVTATGSGTFTCAITSDPTSYTSGGNVYPIDETVAPNGVVWTDNPVSEATALSIGTLAPGQCAAIWQKRVVPPNTTVATPADTSRIAFRAYI